MACADVSSANTVGYMQNNLGENYTPAGASFVSIGTDGFKLSQLKVIGAPSGTASKIQIQVLNSLGSATAYYNYYKGGRGAYATEGWYSSTTLIDGSDAAHEVVFPAGQGLWIKGVANLKYETSGEVLTRNLSVTLGDNYTMVANPFAAPIKLSQLIIAGAPSGTASKIQIQVLNSLGSATAYYNYYKGGRGAYATEGWYSSTTLIDGSDAAHEVEFPAGQALWIKAVNGVTATITCPYTLTEAAK